MLRRRREKKTDYRQRLALLKSGKIRLVVRRTNNNIHIQLIEYHKKGDKTVLEEISKNLKKYGWKGHCGSLSAAYLTGLLIGFRAAKKNVSEAILNSGLQISVKGSAVYAAVSGARDAGMKIPADRDILPPHEKVSGRHVADYAAMLKKDSSEKYRKQFSGYLKNGLEPEKIHEHFEEVKKKITDEFGGTIKKIAEEKKESDEEWEDASSDEEKVKDEKEEWTDVGEE